MLETTMPRRVDEVLTDEERAAIAYGESFGGLAQLARDVAHVAFTRIPFHPYDNTPAAVESATGVPTTAEAIAAREDGSIARVPCIVGHPATSVNGRPAVRELVYVSLTSGLIVRQLSAQPVAVAEFTTQDDRIAGEPMRRTFVLAHDPWHARVGQLQTAEHCAKRLLAHEVRYLPAIVTQRLLDGLDDARAALARESSRSEG